MPKITIHVSEKNESTAYPWWMIVDPQQNFKTNNEGLHRIASMITGPFFSREEAEAVLRQRRYHYGPNAKVYCASGYATVEYRDAIYAQILSEKTRKSNAKTQTP